MSLRSAQQTTISHRCMLHCLFVVLAIIRDKSQGPRTYVATAPVSPACPHVKLHMVIKQSDDDLHLLK